MTTVAAADGAPHAADGSDRRPPPESAGRVPERAEGVELIGEYEACGYRRPPALVRRGDGQVMQLTPLLYAALEAVDGRRTLAEVAEEVSQRVGKTVSADNARVLVDEKLVECGLVVCPDGSQPELKRFDPLLALRLRATVLTERWTNRVTAPFSVLLHPLVALPAILAFGAAVVWLLGMRGVASGTRDLLYSPVLMVTVFVATALSAGFHEFGHAAALRYSGGRPGRIGAGLYLVWPAFFTDVTDAYRLNRAGRLRTDLGGLYFNALFVLATVGLWWVTGIEALLVLVPLQLLQMVHQLLPAIRMDGYHILSDLCGVPDLFARIKPTLRRLVPGREPEPEATALKPWVQVVVTLWVLLVIPLLIGGLVLAVISFPRVAATAWDSTLLQWRAATSAFGDGKWASAAVRVIGTTSVVLPVAGTVYILARTSRRMGAGAWSFAARARAGRPLLLLAAVTLAAGLAWLWWPNGEYRPIQPEERGTIGDGFRAASEVRTGRPGLSPDREAELGGAPALAEAGDPEEVAPTLDDQLTEDPAPTTTTVPSSDETSEADDDQDTTSTTAPTSSEEPTESDSSEETQ